MILAFCAGSATIRQQHPKVILIKPDFLLPLSLPAGFYYVGMFDRAAAELNEQSPNSRQGRLLAKPCVAGCMLPKMARAEGDIIERCR